MNTSAVVCNVCPRHCALEEGSYGSCGARVALEGAVRPAYYGVLTALALDPIEKKPLRHFHPGSRVLSLGSLGCNMHCPFCQNHDISQRIPGENTWEAEGREFTPAEILRIAKEAAADGNIGVAYTYNEPLVCFEYVRDCAVLIRKAGMFNVLVSNGCVTDDVTDEILPLMDAMNIDLKGFRPDIYERLGGNLAAVKRFITRASESAHVEITSLIVPGFNDSASEMEEEAEWLSSLKNEPVLHLTRYFPNYRYGEPATDIGLLRELKEIAGRYLKRVYLGNV
ncbi:MAG: AmmeMemoRadiSam system radical SAM enzyme [Lachnospiraceae bacterium]|nr:AmmeMemoRadiSam system radical SAM enzyme [Lachnospiraceae bacterium]